MAHPVYTLNLTAAQRSVLEWLTQNGGLFTTLEVDPEQIADDCSTSVSTVHDALTRLTALRLIQRPGETTLYRVNPRFFFAQNPELAHHRRPASARSPARRPRRPPPPRIHHRRPAPPTGTSRLLTPRRDHELGPSPHGGGPRHVRGPRGREGPRAARAGAW
ncbi:MarR family transcriptional regulator [Streptomyces sp. NPDC048209]|uniref:MarR family transcriptional regulator n=1 Tax=Streptomyces sp. NPDC048209 TaxID=3156689 RepID=UPI003449A098